MLKGSTAPSTYAPSWEEDLLWNEDTANMLTPETLLLFEILEFGPRLPVEQLIDGWMPVAWAFLVPQPNVTPEGAPPLRLQLFSYPAVDTYRKLVPLSLNIPRIFMLWHSNSRIRYPSTLYVSAHPIPKPAPSAPTLRPFTPLDTQFLSRPYVQSNSADRGGVSASTAEGGSPSKNLSSSSGALGIGPDNQDKAAILEYSGIKVCH